MEPRAWEGSCANISGSTIRTRLWVMVSGVGTRGDGVKSMSVQITIENEGDIIRLMQTLPAEIFEKVQQVLKNGAVRIAERARELAPVRTGHLMASVRADIGERTEGEAAFDPVEVVADTPYASFVEFGTSKMEAQPFLTPAAEETEPEILEEINSILRELGFESE